MSQKMKGGVIQRGSTWSYVVRERDPKTGMTKARWVGGYRTQAEAKRARTAAAAAVDRGTYVAPQANTVGEWLDRWIDAHEVELKPSTAASYRAYIERYLKPLIGHERVQSLSPSRLSVMFKTMGESGGRNGKPLSGRTVEYARAILRAAMKDAIVERLIEVNPVDHSKRPPQIKPQHTTWTGEQLRTFLEGVSDDRLHPLWTLVAATGMRRGELLGLRWDDVDLEAGVVSVNRSTTQIGNDRVTTLPKNHERRRINIDPQTVTTLKAWKRAQAEERVAIGPAWVDTEGHLFTWQDGRPLQPDYVSKRFQGVQAGKGLPRLTLHELRHTHITILLRERVPVHVVAKRAGHKDPSVTLNVYADVIPQDDDAAVDVFRTAVWGA